MTSSFLNQIKTDAETLKRYAKDPVYEGAPQAVFEAQDLHTTAQILDWANTQKMPVTFCGSQTAMTGSGVAQKGLSLNLNAMNKILDIGIDPATHEPFALCEPGLLISDLKNEVEAHGYFYPPDPTSFKEATLGGTVSTNATGADSYKYGSTRLYIKELKVLLASGTFKTLTRTNPLPPLDTKNKAGFYLNGEAIDEIIGSEGTLALITQIKVKLLSHEGKNVFLMVLPFLNAEKAIKATLAIHDSPLFPRAIEWIGDGASAFFQSSPDCPTELKTESCFLYIKQEYTDAFDLQKKIDEWHHFLKTLYSDLNQSQAFNRIFLAESPAQQNALQRARHWVPLKVNETYFPFTKKGGGKVGTDWWVPLNHLQNMMTQTLAEAKASKIPFLIFGHIGNGHPHLNFLCQNEEEFQNAHRLVLNQCERAVVYGGGVAGEHGIGKLKRDLLKIQHPPSVILEMLKVKQKWDPNGILAPGNLF